MNVEIGIREITLYTRQRGNDERRKTGPAYHYNAIFRRACEGEVAAHLLAVSKTGRLTSHARKAAKVADSLCDYRSLGVLRGAVLRQRPTKCGAARLHSILGCRAIPGSRWRSVR